MELLTSASPSLARPSERLCSRHCRGKSYGIDAFTPRAEARAGRGQSTRARTPDRRLRRAPDLFQDSERPEAQARTGGRDRDHARHENSVAARAAPVLDEAKQMLK